jgi:hypothetical protein
MRVDLSVWFVVFVTVGGSSLVGAVLEWVCGSDDAAPHPAEDPQQA